MMSLGQRLRGATFEGLQNEALNTQQEQNWSFNGTVDEVDRKRWT
jgi:hypothetical protein